MAKHLTWRGLQEVATGYPHCSVTVAGLDEKVPPSAATQSNALEAKAELPFALRVSLGSSKIHNGQAINGTPKDFGSLESNKSLAHLQTPTPEQPQDSTLSPQLYSQIDLISKKQTQAWPMSNHPESPSTVHLAKVRLPSQHSMPSFQNTRQNTKTSQGLCDIIMKRHERVETKEISVPKDQIEETDLNGFHPHEDGQNTIRSTGISQGECFARVRSSITSSIQLKDTAKPWIPEKEEATSKSSWKNMPRNAFQYGNISTKCEGQQDSLKNSSPPPASEQTQKVVTRKKILYDMLAELKYLADVLFQVLENTEGDQPKVKGNNVELPLSKLSASSHPSEGLYDTNHSRAASHASLKEHNHQFTYRRSGHKLQSGVNACEQHPKQVKTGMGFDPLPTPKGHEHLHRYRVNGDKHKSGLAVQRACNPGKIRITFGLGHCQHRSPEGHCHSFRYTQIEDKEQPGASHKAFDPHQSTKNEMGCGCLINTKENHPVTINRNWRSVALRVAAQGAFDTQ